MLKIWSNLVFAFLAVNAFGADISPVNPRAARDKEERLTDARNRAAYQTATNAIAKANGNSEKIEEALITLIGALEKSGKEKKGKAK
jgi:hypothetical protein